jgi:homoserine/homoserine lactone efflux protein
MDWGVWSLYAATTVAACLAPGPAVMLVVSAALTRGAVASLWVILGILVANTVYFALSGTGIGALLLASYDLFSTVKWAGAAYLLWLGIRALTAKPIATTNLAASQPAHVGWRMVRDGMALQLANPSALVFFAALLPQFIRPDRNIATQVAVLTVTGNFIEIIVLGLYGLLADRAARAARGTALALWTNRISGILLIAAAVAMVAIPD